MKCWLALMLFALAASTATRAAPLRDQDEAEDAELFDSDEDAAESAQDLDEELNPQLNRKSCFQTWDEKKHKYVQECLL
uniref:UCR_hinge domain-containing protein n=1 Tax=Macrostomum lignano TaxID=282301 RepID=A0A1I8HEB4_9PLAT